MTGPALTAAGAGRFRLAGPLVSETIETLLAAGAATLPASGDVCVDLAEVTRVDSAGLALLLDWLATVRGRGDRFEVLHMPARLRAIAEICDVEDLLEAPAGPAAAAWTGHSDDAASPPG